MGLVPCEPVSYSRLSCRSLGNLTLRALPPRAGSIATNTTRLCAIFWRFRFQPAADFPVDDSGYGFDNIASVLSLSPALMEKYLTAAEALRVRQSSLPRLPKPSFHRYAARDFRLPSRFRRRL